MASGGDINIRSYTFDEYVKHVRSFHGHEAIGVIIGGFMVDVAYQHLPEEGIFDALCETSKCLPDAIQLLTPCTLGNGWLTVINVGRFALTLYDKETGKGVRVFLDPVKLKAWPEIMAWFLKLKTKDQQDCSRLLSEARQAGTNICSFRQVKVADLCRQKKHRGEIGICSQCHEAYPLADGAICFACQGEEMYCHLP